MWTVVRTQAGGERNQLRMRVARGERERKVAREEDQLWCMNYGFIT